MTEEPFFLELEHVAAIHQRSLAEHGGSDGVRDPGGLEAAVMQPRNVYHYLGGDLFGIAAAYAYHIAEAQACIDGNKEPPSPAPWCFWNATGSIPRGSIRWIYISR